MPAVFGLVTSTSSKYFPLDVGSIFSHVYYIVRKIVCCVLFFFFFHIQVLNVC